MDEKLWSARTKTLSLPLIQHREMTVPATYASKREERRGFDRTSNLGIWSDDRKKSLWRENQACWVLQAPGAGQSPPQGKSMKRVSKIPRPNEEAKNKRSTRPMIYTVEEDAMGRTEQSKRAREIPGNNRSQRTGYTRDTLSRHIW